MDFICFCGKSYFKGMFTVTLATKERLGGLKGVTHVVQCYGKDS